MGIMGIMGIMDVVDVVDVMGVMGVMGVMDIMDALRTWMEISSQARQARQGSHSVTRDSRGYHHDETSGSMPGRIFLLLSHLGLVGLEQLLPTCVWSGVFVLVYKYTQSLFLPSFLSFVPEPTIPQSQLSLYWIALGIYYILYIPTYTS
jgi:hypothetical protein